METNIDVNDLVTVLRQQLSNAQHEVALNSALVMALRKKIDELEKQLVATATSETKDVVAI